MKKSTSKIYYHFTGDTLRDGRPIPPIGKWLTHTGKLIPCVQGLHASKHPFDALRFAPGNRLHRVQLGEKTISHGDPTSKVVSNKRKIVASIDATEVLQKFARLCALSCLQNWKCEVPAAVKEYLETGDENKRLAARSAARLVAYSVAWSATHSAHLARLAVYAATDAATDAAYSARSARSVAYRARLARSATRSAQRALFERMVDEAFSSQKS